MISGKMHRDMSSKIEDSIQCREIKLLRSHVPGKAPYQNERRLRFQIDLGSEELELELIHEALL
eukprot:1742961-Amphidinium_carterae.1